MKLYWDDVNECVTQNKDCALIIKGFDNNIYIEDYYVGNGQRFCIAYSQKDLGRIYDLRKAMCEKHGLMYSDLRKLVKLTIPMDKYDELLAEWSSKEEVG